MAWSTALSGLRTGIAVALLVAVGLFGAGLCWQTGVAVAGGTAAWPTAFAGVFGAGIAVFAGRELSRLR